MKYALDSVRDAVATKTSIAVDSREQGGSAAFISDSRAAEAVDIYILYLLSRNKIEEARDVAQRSALKGYLSADVGQLLLANVASTLLMKRKNPSSVLSSHECRASSNVHESIIR